jgi:hypothetical protein
MEIAMNYHTNTTGSSLNLGFASAEPQLCPQTLFLLRAQKAQQQRHCMAHSTANVANQTSAFYLVWLHKIGCFGMSD